MILRRLAGALLVAAVLLPLHRVLDPARTGLAGRTTRSAAEAVWAAGLLGTLPVVVAAALLARLTPLEGLRRWVGALTARMTRASPWAWAAGVGATTLLLAGAGSLLLFGGRPTSVDEMVQLLHARALLEGRAALALPGPPEAWLVQNGVLTGAGWASIYPPGHTVLLALGAALGATWLVGPVGAGVTAALTCLSLDRLLTDDGGTARWAGLLAALSPFLLLLGGTHLSHATAAALAALVLWSALRARDGHPGWAVLVGAAVGALVCTRPWTGLALGVALPLAVWLPGLRAGTGTGAGADPGKGPTAPRALLVRGTGVLMGGAPFALALLTWNAHLFGHPLRLGYTATFGPSHGLGFHPDPWGNAYGPLEALGYTGADLLLLGAHLLETPVPAVLVVGGGLLLTPRLLRGSGVLLAWAGVAVLANALYWHHGMHLGPRLLYEAAPAWSALVVVSLVALLRAEPPLPRWRAGLTWMAVLSLMGATVLLPARLSITARDARATATVAPPPAPEGPSLVLVHGSWSSRVAARLAASGMRRDSVETALRRNDLCRAGLRATWRREGGGSPPALDLSARPGTPPGLRTVEISPGNRVLLDPGLPLSPACSREARADAVAGTLELEPFLWQAPPLPGVRTLLARDLGPEGNRALLAAHPERTPWLLVAGAGEAPPRLLPYREGMERVWGVTDGE